MDRGESWRDCFKNWPADVRRRGVVVTSFNEQIPFANFTTGETILLVERSAARYRRRTHGHDPLWRCHWPEDHRPDPTTGIGANGLHMQQSRPSR